MNFSHQDRNQISIAEQVPIREIADSIFEMLTRISKLNINDPRSPHEYRAIVERIKTQAFCMQLVIQNQKGSCSQQFDNMMRRLNDFYTNPNVHPLVRECIREIFPILSGEIQSRDYLKYTPNVYGSPNIITAIFKSQNHMDERSRLAQNNPNEYFKQDRFNIHGFNQDKNSFVNELYPQYHDTYNSKNTNGTSLNGQILNEDVRNQGLSSRYVPNRESPAKDRSNSPRKQFDQHQVYPDSQGRQNNSNEEERRRKHEKLAEIPLLNQSRN